MMPKSCRALAALLALPACVATPYPRDPPTPVAAPASSSASPDSLVTRAAAQLRGGDTTGAIESYRQAIAINPEHGAAGLLISALYDAGRTEEAFALGDRYRRHGPRNPRALFRYGWVLGYVWEIDAAEAVFRELIAMDSGGIYEAWGHGELAYMARARGDADAAVRHMELAVRARPDDVISRIGLAHMLLNADRAREALPILVRELERDTLARGYGGIPAQMLLGWAYGQLGDSLSARAAFDRLAPRIAQLGNSRVMQFFALQGRRAEALAAAARIPRINLYGAPEINDNLVAALRGASEYEALLARSRANVTERRRRLGLGVVRTP